MRKMKDRQRLSCTCLVFSWAANNSSLTSLRGLGIGTTPAALIAHGINTTILEIDPVVYDYAVQYFDLQSNHTAIIGDAIDYVEGRQRNPLSPEKFDFIIHDVFTGGAEPIQLFTSEFLTGLKRRLKKDGIIAIVST